MDDLKACKHTGHLKDPHVCPYKDELAKERAVREELCCCCSSCEESCARDI